MKVLYIGDGRKNTNSALRSQALVRLGGAVALVSPENLFGSQISGRWLGRIHYWTGFKFLDRLAARRLEAYATGDHQLVWVNSGEWLGPRALAQLRTQGRKMVLYVNDDPLSRRDGNRWRSLLAAAKHYDLIAVVREQNVAELQALGVPKVLRVWMSYDELAHRPPALTPAERAEWSSEVSFIGTWMPERGPFLVELLRQGVPLSIWGDRWPKAPEWPVLRQAYRGPPLSPTDYTKAVAVSKISLGLLSKGNRDLHTRRSAEIPYIGGLLCAERTSEHAAMYRDGSEAVFWSTAAECAATCHALLADAERRERIRLAGMTRVRQLGMGNEDVCRRILAAVDA